MEAARRRLLLPSNQVLYLHARESQAVAWQATCAELEALDFVVEPDEPEPQTTDQVRLRELDERRIDQLIGCDGLLILGTEPLLLSGDILLLGRHSRQQARSWARQAAAVRGSRSRREHPAAARRIANASRYGIDSIDHTHATWQEQLRSWLIEASAIGAVAEVERRLSPEPLTDLDDVLDAPLPPAPYPGLRPFESDEWPIFFGREPMTDEVIGLLIERHLVVVHGDFGCGKSSLVRAGVRPSSSRARRQRHALAHRNDAAARGAARQPRRRRSPACGEPTRAQRSHEIRRLLNRRRDARAGACRASAPRRPRQRLHAGRPVRGAVRLRQEGTAARRPQLFADFLVGLAGEAASRAVRMILTMRSEFLGVCARFKGFRRSGQRDPVPAAADGTARA